MSNLDSGSRGQGGFIPPYLRPEYKTYRSPHAPGYKVQQNYHGITPPRIFKFAASAALFGGVGVFALLYFASEVPRVRNDILVKVPILGTYWYRETPPEDDPF